MTNIEKRGPIYHLNPWTDRWHEYYGGPEIPLNQVLNDSRGDGTYTTQDRATREFLHVNSAEAFNDITRRDNELRAALKQHHQALGAHEGRDKDVRVRQTYDNLLRIHNGDEKMLKINLGMYTRDSQLAEMAGETGSAHGAEHSMFGNPEEQGA